MSGVSYFCSGFFCCCIFTVLMVSDICYIRFCSSIYAHCPGNFEPWAINSDSSNSSFPILYGLTTCTVCTQSSSNEKWFDVPHVWSGITSLKILLCTSFFLFLSTWARQIEVSSHESNVFVRKIIPPVRKVGRSRVWCRYFERKIIIISSPSIQISLGKLYLMNFRHETYTCLKGGMWSRKVLVVVRCNTQLLQYLTWFIFWILTVDIFWIVDLFWGGMPITCTSWSWWECMIPSSLKTFSHKYARNCR